MTSITETHAVQMKETLHYSYRILVVGYSAMFGRLSWTRLSSLRFSLRFMIAFGLRFRQRTQVVSEKIVSKSCLKRKRSAFMTEASRGLFADEVDWKGKSLIKIESGCFLCRSDHSWFSSSFSSWFICSCFLQTFLGIACKAEPFACHVP